MCGHRAGDVPHTRADITKVRRKTSLFLVPVPLGSTCPLTRAGITKVCPSHRFAAWCVCRWARQGDSHVSRFP